MSDELGDECEELRLGIETVNKRNEIRRNFNQKVTLSYKSPDAKIVDRYMGQTERSSKLPEEIRETFLMEGAGAYQGGEKENTGQTKKLSEIFKKKKNQMKKSREILNKELDILAALDSDIENDIVPDTPQKEVKRNQRRGRTSAAATRRIDEPSKQLITTPKRKRSRMNLWA